MKTIQIKVLKEEQESKISPSMILFVEESIEAYKKDSSIGMENEEFIKLLSSTEDQD